MECEGNKTKNSGASFDEGINNLSPDESDIADPMADVLADTIYADQKKFARMELKDKIVEVASGFTEVHKKVADSLRPPQGDHMDANLAEALRVLENPPPPPKKDTSKLLEKRQKMLSSLRDIQIPTKRKTSDSSESKLTYDYMSGIWNMMEEDRKDKPFVITPKGYEYQPDAQTFQPMDEEQVEESKEKCENWLKTLVED